MDLERMLRNCERDQWTAGDIDWSKPPRPMSEDDEQAIVQLFTDMAGIERLAGALFFEQARRTSDPTLRAIFRSFVGDEVRHAHVAQMLADHYNVRYLRSYQQNPNLTAFAPHFVRAIRYLGDDVANVYITTGEIILDVALLRSINDYVRDETSARAMVLINRDESRHVAIDFHMAEYYSSAAYRERREDPDHARSAAESAQAAYTFARVLYHAKPFIDDVFIRPMNFVDPSGRRLLEAFKRTQQIGAKEGATDLPFSRFLKLLQDAYELPVVGRVFGDVLGRVAGLEPAFLRRLNTRAELAAAREKSFQELAEEILALKHEDERPSA
jgi:hypothetical protein